MKRQRWMVSVGIATLLLMLAAWSIVLTKMAASGLRPSVEESLSTHNLEARLVSADPKIREEAVRAAAWSPDELTVKQAQKLVEVAVRGGLRTELSRLYFADAVQARPRLFEPVLVASAREVLQDEHLIEAERSRSFGVLREALSNLSARYSGVSLERGDALDQLEAISASRLDRPDR